MTTVNTTHDANDHPSLCIAVLLLLIATVGMICSAVEQDTEIAKLRAMVYDLEYLHPQQGHLPSPD